jgi:transketolase
VAVSAVPTFEKGKAFPTRDGYGRGLYLAGRTNADIVALDADLSESTRSLWFGKEHPDRFFNMGIAEQDMVVTAAGMAASGKIAFCSTFAIFMERAFEQVRNAVARPNQNVKIVGSHGGLMTGEDGTSAQAIEDIGLYRLLPHFAVCVAADAVEAEKAVQAMVERPGPAYLRLTRQKVPVLFDDAYRFTWGRGQVLREGRDVTLAACGAVVCESLKAADILAKENVGVEVLNLASVKPLDRELLVQSARKTGLVVTAEDHSVIGGLGGAVAEALGEEAPTPLVRIGLPDRYAESGSPVELYEKYGLSGTQIANAVRGALSKKR